MTEKKPSAGKGANASFCIPKAAIMALLEARADAMMIGTYLTLACFTDVTGEHSSATKYAVRRHMSTNLDRARNAIDRLAATTVRVGNKKPIALLYSREAWIKATGEEAFPDGPTERGKIRYVLPDFGEELGDRVWFSRNLVEGIGLFRQPLKHVKDAGDAAAQLFLQMQQAVDVAGWLAIPPNAGPWSRYETVLDETVVSSRVIHGQHEGLVMVTSSLSPDKQVAFDAIHALIGSGLFYEVVMVLNRAPVTRRFAKKADGTPGDEFGDVASDAEPLYELDARSLHGFKPEGEEGLGGLTARTVGELGYPVTAGYSFNPDDGTSVPGQFILGKYAAIVPKGYAAMIVGVYRPRFRVANPKNAGVKDAWIRIYENQRAGRDWIEQLRRGKGLGPLVTEAEG